MWVVDVRGGWESRERFRATETQSVLVTIVTHSCLRAWRERRGREAVLLPEEPLTEMTLSRMHGNKLQFVYIPCCTPDGLNNSLDLSLVAF